MRAWGRSSVRVLIAAMIVVATCFATAIVYFESATERVRRETEGMLSNGVPSADQLTTVRATLRDLDGALDSALVDVLAERPVDRGKIFQARRDLDAAIREYRALPFYALEEELNHDLDVEVHRLDELEQRFLHLVDGGKLQAAHELENGKWRRQSDRVDDALRELTAFNIRHVSMHALRIDRVRKRSAIVGMAVGTVGVFLAFAATIVAARAVKRQLELQEERATELEMFSARVAHDVLSPLAAVSLGLEMAKQQIPDERVITMTTKMLNTLRRVNKIVDGLYEFARASGRPRPGLRAPAHEILAEVCEEARPQAERAGITVTCHGIERCDVACAPGVLAVLLTNLINNAIKFMGDSPERLITVGAERRDAALVRFWVRDTGPGVPEGFETMAFEPYARVAAELPGLGLGLATVKRLAEAHHGHVGLDRGEGRGATFWFELPCAPGK